MKRLALIVSLLFIGCDDPAPARQEPTTAPAVSSAQTQEPQAAPASDALDALDQRKPVPLLPMMAHHQKQQMRDHLVAVQEIVTALATDDFSSVEKSAGRIGFSEGEAKMCEHMGAAAPGFTEQAIGFHKAADGISAAAKEKDRGKVLSALSATLKTCTSCHATWKQSVVSEARWSELAGQAAPMHPMH